MRIDAAEIARDPFAMRTRVAAAAAMAMAVAVAIMMAMATLLVGCKAPGPANTPVPHSMPSFKYGTGDGQTMATAVEIRTRSETEGGALLLGWIRSNYPGFTIQNQQLVEQRNHAYNLVTIIGPSNTAHLLYFDISSYYRSFRNDNFPKPLP
jgi:hypothetical protein